MKSKVCLSSVSWACASKPSANDALLVTRPVVLNGELRYVAASTVSIATSSVAAHVNPSVSAENFLAVC
jgi:hypothetical protein